MLLFLSENEFKELKQIISSFSDNRDGENKYCCKDEVKQFNNYNETFCKGTGQMIDLGFPQYCSLTILCQLSDWATFIFLRKHGYNTEIENILQKRSTFGDGTWSGLLAVPALH